MAMRKDNQQQLLILCGIVRREKKHSPSGDRRRRVNYALASYRGEQDHDIYRKAFRSYGEPVVPQSGTHAELNALAEQY